VVRWIADAGSWLFQLFFPKKGVAMPPFRASRFIDFNTGTVIKAPMDLKKSMPATMTTDQKIDLFECRLEVWQLGVAAEMLKQIEAARNPSIWSHAAYGLVSVSFSYFEMIGKTLNPQSAASNTASEDFNVGFCTVYPKFKPTNGIYKDKLPSPPAPPRTSNPDLQTVIAFRNRIRNGMYHLGYTKKGLWLHNDVGKDDFQVVPEPNPSGPGMVDVYHMNPHATTRTIIDHFPKFAADLRDPAKGLQTKFVDFFDNYHVA
jgi:hypothetical protein